MSLAESLFNATNSSGYAIGAHNTVMGSLVNLHKFTIESKATPNNNTLSIIENAIVTLSHYLNAVGSELQKTHQSLINLRSTNPELHKLMCKEELIKANLAFSLRQNESTTANKALHEALSSDSSSVTAYIQHSNKMLAYLQQANRTLIEKMKECPISTNSSQPLAPETYSISDETFVASTDDPFMTFYNRLNGTEGFNQSFILNGFNVFLSAIPEELYTNPSSTDHSGVLEGHN